jgi:hypothetical protein
MKCLMADEPHEFYEIFYGCGTSCTNELDRKGDHIISLELSRYHHRTPRL